MNLKNWSKLFLKTLLVGAVVSIITGFLLPFSRESISFKDVSDVLFYVLILFGFGALTSVYSQLGFFAYMILNYTAIGVFPKKAWQYIQLVLAILALLEVVFFRSFVGRENSQMADLLLGLAILVVAVAVAYFKARATNATAWVPTLFFMIAVTIVEMVGGLKINENNATIFIVVPLLACNAYQILILHKVLKPKKS
ncbi:MULTISPECIES: KinB-signaling pathway activation protein [Paenibacillus]|uniref:KinB-signaling pathway activation protein n=1 Tax=Paenibacillus albilobatus TaxID=2716884 RepID=A0A919XQI9_9BACL|nr:MULTISPECIES: KinB-signaling pathway activation protein [Paenibacillus]GIO34912.1 KinB-signaling pathway activation protein [Paenibacillus albilobatus]